MRDDQVYTPVGLGTVTSKAGYRTHPVTGKGDFHNGVDLAAKLNDQVFNLLDGYVVRVGYRGAMGVAVEVYHPYPNIRTICGHLNGYAVKPGDWVRRGQVIGFAGSTGRSTGVHVHYTVIKQDTNQYVEPMTFLFQVPEYVKQLQTARAQAASKANAQAYKKEAAKKPPAKLPEEEKEDRDDHPQTASATESTADPAPPSFAP